MVRWALTGGVWGRVAVLEDMAVLVYGVSLTNTMGIQRNAFLVTSAHLLGLALYLCALLDTFV